MTEGTKSVLIGAHDIFHSLWVMLAWKKLYGRYPRFWEIVCILLHDIGYWGKNYLTTYTNAGHAELGAKIAEKLFGTKGYLLVLGHSRSAAKKHGIDLSRLEPPDDYSWLIAPKWWMWKNYRIEKFLTNPDEWVEAVQNNWKNEERIGGFNLYLGIQNNDLHRT